ncbi:hypothetical protein BHM03_00025933 [Ensete ventricosum]|nr:hypothetical protein BHM03_00025933 [Ensete ventricosum]
MLMNMKEGDHYVVNRGEGLTTFDFDDDISMTEEGAGMAGSWCGTEQTQQNGWSISCRWTTEWRIDRVGIRRRNQAVEQVQKSSSAAYGVGKVPLLVRGDAIVVVHEEDDLVQKDASTEE